MSRQNAFHRCSGSGEHENIQQRTKRSTHVQYEDRGSLVIRNDITSTRLEGGGLDAGDGVRWKSAVLDVGGTGVGIRRVRRARIREGGQGVEGAVETLHARASAHLHSEHPMHTHVHAHHTYIQKLFVLICMHTYCTHA